MEHGAEVACHVRVLTMAHEVARGHEHPAVVGVSEGDRQHELQDDAEREQATVGCAEQLPTLSSR